jgi:enoyl-CoA hydratase
MPIRTESSGAVGWVTLDRPERAHAYDRIHLDALLEGTERLARSCAVLVIGSTGAGAFCGGADLDAMRHADPLDALELRSQRVFTTIARLPVVTICVVQGAAVAGGFELALACDLRVAGPAARFWLPETKLGILPSAGGTTRLARLVGPSRAKEVILGGRGLDAETARAWGIVHRVADDPRAEAGRWAEEVAQRDPLALAMAKELLDATESDGALARERQAEAVLYARKAGRRG